MSSAAPLILGTAGAVVGGIFGGPTGAMIGWSVGSSIGASFAPAQKVQGPRLADLKITGVQYGDPIPYVQGTMRVPGQVWWASDRREIAHTTNVDSGGKGGGPEVEQTTYTYEVDILFGLTDNEIAGVTRIWLNGKLVWTNLDSDSAGNLFINAGGGGLLATAIANALSSLTASGNTMHWRRITVYTGDQDQQPDPTYEAAVGTEDAVAYRDRGSVFIEGLQLGSSGVIPNLTFEVVTRGASGSVDSTVLFQINPATNDFDDISSHALSPTVGSSITIVNDLMNVANGASGAAATLTYPDTSIAGKETKSYTFEYFAKFPTPSGFSPPSTVSQIVTNTGGPRIRRFNQASVPESGFLVFSNGSGAGIFNSANAAPSGVLCHICQMYRGSDDGTETTFLYIDGVLQGSDVSDTGALPDAIFGGSIQLFGVAPLGFQIGEVRLKLGLEYNLAGFDPPDGFDDPDAPTSVITPLEEDLADVVQRLCVRAGLTVDQVDVTGLQGSPQKVVRGMAITQVTSTRSVLEMLASAYFFESHCRDKLYFVERGGASVATIDYEDMGATESDDPPETFELRQGNDIELPAQVSITYANYYDDYQNDTQNSDRLVSAVDRSVATVQLPLSLTPSEAKAIADTMVLDQYVSMVGATVRVLGTEGSEIEPTDIISPTDADDETYRMRVVEVLDNYPLIEMECVLDNSVLLQSAGTTSNDYAPSIVVEEPPDAEMELMDIPILRDADDDSGFYAAMKGSITNWPGGGLYKSIDNADYDLQEEFTESAVLGTTTTALGDWEQGRYFDDYNTVTVNVGNGTLSSSTRTAVLNDQSVNAMLVGDEIIQFVTATLISTGLYTLSRLLRGCRGTEWAMTGHSSSESAVLLRMAGLRRIDMQSNELGMSRYWAAVTFGRPLSSGLTGSPLGGESFTNFGIGLRPFSPVAVRIAREVLSGDITITALKRSRLAVRMIGSLGINVPDDDTASYLLDILSNEGSPQTVHRTLTGSVSGEVITWTYTADQQTTDSGSPTASQISVGAYAFSTTVGRGRGTFKTG